MPINLPQFDTTRFSIGPAVIYIGAAGVLPVTDFGAITSTEIKFNVETNKFVSGAPAVPHWYTFKSGEVTITIRGIEWDLYKLQKAVGGYYVTSTVGGYTTQTLYGTFEVVDAMSMRIVHLTPTGSTVTLDVFSAIPGSGSEIKFGDKVHDFPFTFHPVAVTNDFTGNALPPNTSFTLTYVKAT